MLERLLQARREVGQLVMRESSSARLLQRCCQIIAETLGWPGVWGVCCDEQGRISTRAWSGGALTQRHVERLGTGEPMACVQTALAHSGIRYTSRDVAECQGCPLLGDASGDGLVKVRLEHGEAVLGALVLQSPVGGRPDPLLRHFVQDLCADLALALHNVRLERRRAETEVQLQSVTANAKDAIVMMGPDGRVSLWNAAAEEAFGHAAEEAIGQPIHGLLAPARYHQACRAGWPDFQRHGRGPAVGRTLELQALHREGHEVPIELSLSAIQRLDGWHALAIIRDVTEARELRARLAQADRLASIGMMAAGIAHEVNNPLSYVLANLEELQARLRQHELEEGSARSSDELEILAAEVAEGAERIRAIVRDLRTFSRVGSEELTAVDPRIPLEAAVRMACNQIRHRACLEQRCDPVPPVLANEGKLAQVFLNLLVNAAQAIPEGEVSANVIELTLRAEGDSVLVSVRDSGQGISPEQQRRLFEPFFSTKATGAGAGLGLSICRRIVTDLGGEIRLASEPGRGSTFTVCLPALPQLQPRPEPLPASPAPDGRRARVLVVDDERLVGRALERVLSRHHEVVCANSVARAKEILEEDPAFDVLLSDIMMPHQTGMDLHAWLEANHPGLASRTIFMTGGAFTPGAQSFLARVSNPHIDKPLRRDELLATIASLL